MFDSELFISLLIFFIVLWVYTTEKFNSLKRSRPAVLDRPENDRWRKTRIYLELISFVKSGCLNFLVLLLRTLSRNKIYILKIILREKNFLGLCTWDPVPRTEVRIVRTGPTTILIESAWVTSYSPAWIRVIGIKCNMWPPYNTTKSEFLKKLGI